MCTVALEVGFIGIKGQISEQSEICSFPNPFTDQVTFEFNCKIGTTVELTILNAQGSTVMTSGNFKCSSGKNSYQWDGKTNSGLDVPAGIYTYRLKLNDRIISGKILKTQ
jgi:flagellar hook assembly protein FlgD